MKVDKLGLGLGRGVGVGVGRGVGVGGELLTGKKLSTAGLKKAEGKKRNPPCTPYREKGKGKENSRVLVKSIRLSRVRTSARAIVAQVVERAVVAFNGTRGPKDSDEAIWAAIAWRIGAENFDHAIDDKISENRCDGDPRDPAAAFQSFLNRRFPKPEGGAR